MRVLDAAMSAVWAMEEPALRQLLEVAAREHEVTPQALEAYRSKAMEKGERARVRDGVAILNAEGALFKRANLMTDFCGASSYDVLMRDFRTALDDDNIRAILWNMDTPGGEAAGVSELAAAITAAKGRKPIVAFASDLAASAGYWLASAADKIVIGPSAAVGSIGVRASITDSSARDERSGVRRFDFVSSQSPFKISDPKTEDGAGRIQARVDALAKVFVETVATNRGVSVEQVLDGFGRGDVLVGQAAVDAGMADEIGTFESVLAKLSQSDPLATIGFKPSAPRGLASKELPTMATHTDDQLNAAVAAARDEATAAATAAAATANAEAVATATAAATASAQAAERDRVSGLFAATVGAFAGYTTERDEAIRSGSSVADFKATLVEKEHAKAAARAAAVSDDVDANAGVRTLPSGASEQSDDDKAVAMILGAYRAR